MSRLLLVRHGETEMNSALRYWGRTDVNLGPAGLQQAQCLAQRLESCKIGCIYSSSMKRAMLTARTISGPHSLEVTGCDELREIDFGDIEGLDYSQVKSRFPHVARMWAGCDPELAYPGGESLEHLDGRICGFMQKLAAHAPDETVLIVAHAAVLRSLICLLMEMESGFRWKIRLDLASLSIVDTYPGTAILSLLNDTSHLSPPVPP
ncbi:MAG: histidine phosphatase family protein [Dehalococcoidales bacterium]|nr:histidine phosphatase family protein [Dehalococcoidales bacterium]